MNWQWLDDHHLHVDPWTFIVGTVDLAPSPDRLFVVKPRHLVERYLELIHAERPRRIVELGTKDGGSAALLALVAEPDGLVTVDLTGTVPPALEHLITDEGLEDSVHARPGIDQSDRLALALALSDTIGDGPLDLVIDDASHVLGPTVASFEVLFPLLREGGLYIIEDWSSEILTADRVARFVDPRSEAFPSRLDVVQRVLHTLNAPDRDLPQSVSDRMAVAHAGRAGWPEPTQRRAFGGAATPDEVNRLENELGGLFGALIDAATHAGLDADSELPPPAPRPMADLAVALSMISASSTGIVDRVTTDGDWITVRRGSAQIDSAEFRLDEAWSDYFGYLP